MLVVGLAVGSASAVTFERSVEQPASVAMSTSADGCRNNPGPQITIEGELALGGINARIIATNNRRLPAQHSGSADVLADFVLVPAGDTIQFAKQPPNDGAGGNPHIFAWFNDCDGGYLTNKPTYLGRCVQGLVDASLNFEMLTDLDMSVTSGSCTNHPGPYVTLDGELRLGGVCATLIFSNNRNFRHTHEENVEVEIILLDLGESIVFQKQGSLPEGVTGNPWLWIQLLDGAGQPMTRPILLGKCVQL
jgi:hypothetical protein